MYRPDDIVEITTSRICRFLECGQAEFFLTLLTCWARCNTAMVGPVGSVPAKYKEYDASHIPAAGASFPAADSASTCLTWCSRPSTPCEIAKYRQSRLHEPGQIYRHFEAAADPVDNSKVYGRVRHSLFASSLMLAQTANRLPDSKKQASNKEETLAKVFKTYPESDMMRWTLDRSEDVYHSNTREPLGKSWHRGHTIPAHLGNDVAFGQKINAKTNSAISLARSAIAPVDREYEVCQEWMSWTLCYAFIGLPAYGQR